VDTFDDLWRMLERVPASLERNLAAAVVMGAQLAEVEAKTNHEYTDRSGTLTNSIGVDGPHGTFANGDLRAILSAGASYAVFVEKGTRPHTIRAKYRKSLRWPTATGFAFAREVQHPGTRPYRFLENALGKVEPELAFELVPDAIEAAFVEAGFERG